MMRPGILLVVAALAVAFGSAGCGDDGPSQTAPRPVNPGRFAGNDGAGIGAAVDFAGFDATKLGIRRALVSRGTGDQAIGIVSLVNRTKSLTEIPEFSAVLDGGRRASLLRATDVDRGGRIVPLPNPGPYIPVEGALTIYVLFDGPIDAIGGVEMRLPGGKPIALTPEPAPSP